MVDNSVTVESLGLHIGKQVTLNGRVHDKKDIKKLVFVKFKDGTGFVQCVLFKPNVSDDMADRVSNLQREDSISITGTVRKCNLSKIGVEIDITSVVVWKDN